MGAIAPNQLDDQMHDFSTKNVFWQDLDKYLNE